MEEDYSLAVMPDTKSPLQPIVDLVKAGREVYDEVKGKNKPPPPRPPMFQGAGSNWLVIAGVALVAVVVVVGAVLVFRKSP